MNTPSPRQAKVYERLLEHHRRTGNAPDLSALARSLGITYVTLKQHLEGLAAKGYIGFEGRGRGRSPMLTLPAAATGIPLLGAIPAGPLSEALSSTEGYLSLPGLSPAHFALRVHGDSMSDLMQSGDVVLLERNPNPREGAICAVRIGEDDATLKYLRRPNPQTIELVAHNPDYPPLRVHAAEVSIDGVYRGLLRGDVLDLLMRDPA
jgi:repressor LexA